MNTLIIHRRGAKDNEIPLRPLTIGRSARNGLQLEEDVISRTHAEILRQDDAYFVKDAGSSNGTFLNGRELTSGEAVRLGHGDRVQLGREGIFELEISIVDLPAGMQTLRQSLSEPLMAHLLKNKIPVWSDGLIAVRVADIVEETPDTKTYRFVGSEGPLIFSYKPGQFVTLVVEIDGKEERRSYSMSSTPSRPHCIELTIKRVAGGLVSNWLADNLKRGDVVKVRGPAGKFTCFEYPSDRLMFVGAGSGITPLMSMTRWILDTAADADLKFLVSARTPTDIIFRRELEFLAARHRTFRCGVTITGGGGSRSWLGPTGRISGDMLKLFTSDICDRHVFTCGPEPFMASVAECLQQIDFPMKNFHQESFGPVRVAKGTLVRPRDAISRSDLDIPLAGKPTTIPSVSQPIYKIEFGASGKTLVTSGRATLLELAEANGVEIDYACRTGACGLCKVTCKPGSAAVEMPDGTCLEADEAEDGTILTCVAKPIADLHLDA